MNADIQFIHNDTLIRKEKIVGDIMSYGQMHIMQVAKIDTGKKRTITYTTAQNKLKGFRRIKN